MYSFNKRFTSFIINILIFYESLNYIEKKEGYLIMCLIFVHINKVFDVKKNIFEMAQTKILWKYNKYYCQPQCPKEIDLYRRNMFVLWPTIKKIRKGRKIMSRCFFFKWQFPWQFEAQKSKTKPLHLLGKWAYFSAQILTCYWSQIN